MNFEMARQDSQPSMPESMVESAAFGAGGKGSQESLASLTSGKLSMRVEKAQARKFKRKMLEDEDWWDKMHVVDQLKYQK